MNTSFKDQLQTQANLTVLEDDPLSKYTTISIGGPAQFLGNVKTPDQMIQALQAAQDHNIPVKVIGGGSNILMPDEGYPGLIIRNQILIFEDIEIDQHIPAVQSIKPRFSQIKELTNYSSDLNPAFQESDKPVFLKLGSGWKMNPLVLRCIKHHAIGLEWFSGIPGSVGGAIYMNMHGGEYYWSDFVVDVQVASLNPHTNQYTQKTLTNQQLKFDYDYSILHKTGDIVLTTTLKLYQGDKTHAQTIFNHWAKKKVTNQPQTSAGCMWQNLTQTQQKKAGLPTPSVGYIIDHELGLKGHSIGSAKISDQHAAFIQNTGNATASDVQSLLDLVESQVKRKFGIQLHREVEIVKN